MQNLRSIIVDDEQGARTSLRVLLSEFIDGVEIIAECEHVSEAVKEIRKQAPDLVFLDIEMPGYTGLELLDFFEPDEVNFHIIFITAYKQYALKAFRLAAIDYLLKPVQLDQLKDAVEKVRLQRYTPAQIATLSKNLEDTEERFLHIKTIGAEHRVKLTEILYIQADGAYSKVQHLKDEPIFTAKHLKYFEKQLSDYKNIIRAHKSFIVNTDHVKQIRSGHAHLSDGSIIPLGEKWKNLSLDK